MVTVREQILRAVVAALNNVRPAGIPETQRSRVVGMAADDLPAMVLYPVKEGTERVGQMTKRLFTFRVECLAQSVDPAQPVDGELDALLAWCTKALAGSKLGGLSQDTQELSTDWDIEAGEAAFGRAAIEFGVRYVTQASDQTAR